MALDGLADIPAGDPRHEALLYFLRNVDPDGADALGAFTSSRSTNEAAYLLQKLFRKSFGTNNPVTLIKATIDALSKLRTRETVERLRGVSLS